MPENVEPTVEQEFTRIDALRSIGQMLVELRSLEPAKREEVVLHGLANSTFRSTWEHMALQHQIHEEKWPART